MYYYYCTKRNFTINLWIEKRFIDFVTKVNIITKEYHTLQEKSLQNSFLPETILNTL